MSQEKVLKTLQNVGLAESEAQIYVFLGKRGPQKAKDITNALKIPKQHLYPALKNLQGKGIINATLERPARFSAVPFEKVLDLFVNVKMEEANRIRQGKEQILSDWHAINLAETADHSPKFTVLEGKNFIYPRLKQMIEETKNGLSIVLPVASLIRADQAGLLDLALKRACKSKAEVRFLTEVNSQNVKALMALLNRTKKARNGFDGRAPIFRPKPFTRIIIRDDEEAVFFLTSNELNSVEDVKDLCLWTNCKALVQSFAAVFEELWLNSEEIQKKITEVNTGIPAPKTCIIAEAKVANTKYDEALSEATKEVLMVTSTKGLRSLLKNEVLLEKWGNRGVGARIMVSIDNENLETAQKLIKHCAVKHVPTVYLGATIIDGQHFFQFKTPLTEQDRPDSLDFFENTFYTTDYEYVKKTEKMLNDMWDSAQTPSPIPFKSIIQQSLFPNKPVGTSILSEITEEYKRIIGFNFRIEPQLGKTTEKEILDKFSKAKKIPTVNPQKDIIRLYCVEGRAIIYPPRNLNLPNFIIEVFHNNKHSSFGVENSIVFLIQTTIADQQAYVPAAFITDNKKGFKFRKAMHENHHSTEIIRLLKKDELNVQADGKRLFAGWTVPIPLLPPKYVLPPSCVMIEGYGKTKQCSAEVTGQFNRRMTFEYNYLEAFVTFMHPSSKYCGPGSDALFHREMIVTSYPPIEKKMADS